eukprot:Phypoly_transcript_11786.p1 GENE.Phypoly_transcript_11786~~Phypoly_transcript_11786.p1  ORF type:complete len:252 (+),score=39.41 Phypoly_transcript_11786:398-1153(+)
MVLLFEAEYAGLQALKETKAILVPAPLKVGTLQKNGSFFIMEYIDFGSLHSDTAQEFGSQLAKMHIYHQDKQKKFGFHINNTIGSTPQINDFEDDWITFYKEKRLKFQLDLLKKGEPGDKDIQKLGHELIDDAPRFSKLFAGIEGPIKPSLIHGDLWSGNYGATRDGQPVIFDPAPYFAHYEAELGIMHMFGSVPASFYEGYNSLLPHQPGYKDRLQLYQLYHYLNHYNMFGSGYRSQCLSILRHLLSVTK